MIKVSHLICRLLYLLLLLIFLYFLCRLFFLGFNRREFSVQSISTAFKLIISGIRFDLSAIFYTNTIFFVLCLQPLPIKRFGGFQIFIKAVFIIVNSIFLLLNCIDIAYFPFVHRRMSADAVLFLSGKKGSDFFHMAPVFIAEYWYIWLLYLLLITILIFGYSQIMKVSDSIITTSKSYLTRFLLLLSILGISVLAIRGGFQKKPLNLIHAAEVADVSNVPVVLNSVFSFIRTALKRSLPASHYLAESSLSTCDIGLFPAHRGPMKKQNVLIIVVESLSKNYPGFFGGPAKTPFIDSLFSRSLVFENGFANAKESIQGIPAILSSIPSLQEDPFIFSKYSTNKITSFANLLKKEGYSTLFFHGGGNGTMGFNSYCTLAGFDEYYGREEYNNDNDFDGSWGIWDEPFLQFSASKMTQAGKPFVSAIFTLNTHHPFKVPRKYKNEFKTNNHPIIACVEYFDYSLGKFFARIKKEEWYNNTLFVITADHTGPKIESKNPSVIDDYRIPIVFFKPDGSLRAISGKVASQIDIMPSVLDLLNFPKPYYSQGKNLFKDDCEHFSVDYNSGIYQYIDSTYCYRFNGQKGIGFYNWRNDPGFKDNLAEKHKAQIISSDRNLKKFIQVFNNNMIGNKMSLH